MSLSIARGLGAKINAALRISPIVYINGARQVGKSTLVRQFAGFNYVSFDNAQQLAVAANAPAAFLRQYKDKLIIDEVQMLPAIFRELKIAADDARLADKSTANGKYLLTGSANIMALPNLSDALVGRMNVLTLYPFSAVEIMGGEGNFLQRLFAADFSPDKIPLTRAELVKIIKQATFPEIYQMNDADRALWFESYITTILQRDVKLLVEVEKAGVLFNILRLMAIRAGGLINDADIARDAGLNAVTAKRYRNILQLMFMTFSLPPYFKNIGKRMIKSSKGYFTDTALLCHVLQYRLEDIADKQPHLFGHIVENFVATELLKQLSIYQHRAELLHFRTSDNKEIDFIIEKPNGQLVAIEVKTSEHIEKKDFAALMELQEKLGEDFACGVILYGGSEVICFGERLFLLPLAVLWG